MHEVLHTALGHPFRHQQDYDQQAFDIACDIVVNSNILYSFGMDRRRITLGKYGESMHIAPDGKEGYNYTVEQVYEMICKALCKPLRKKKPQPKQGNGKRKGQGNS
jgi:predicted metal-dependent peptidase